MKKLITALFVLMMICSVSFAQTYKPDYATKVVLAGGGTSLVNTTTLLAPGGLSNTITLPATAPTLGYVLTTDGSGNLSFTNPLTGITLAGDITGPAGTNVIAATAAAGNRAVTAINLGTGIISFANGGTGVATAPTPGSVVFGATATTQGYTVVGTTGQVLTSAGAGTPTWTNAGATLTLAASTTNNIAGATTNNFAINANQTVYYLQNSTGASSDLTGIIAGAPGRMIILVNNSAAAANVIVLKNQDGGSTNVNQFHLQGASDILLGVDGIATLIYDATANTVGAWRVVSNY